MIFMGFAIPFFVAGQQWLLLGLTSWAVFAAGWSLQRNPCTRCYNLSCPVNPVPQVIREVFFQNYPKFAEAWEIEND